MKKQFKRFDVKVFDLKLFLSLLSGTIILTGFKIYNNDKNRSEGEINIIKSDVEITKEYNKNKNNSNNMHYSYTELEPQSDEYYKSIEINGKTLNFVNTPTPTPTPRYDLIDAHTDDMIIGEDGVYPEGYLEYKDIKDHSLNFKTTDEMISFYSKVFELDEYVSSELITDIIGENDYPLEGAVVINDTDYDSLEEGISRILYDFSNYPDSYGYSEEEVRNYDGYQLDYYYPEELIYKFSNVLDVNPYIALSIAYGESGRALNSYLFINNHNPGGIVSGNGFAKFRNEASGMYGFVKLLHDRYFVRGDSDYSRIKAMSNGYCEDSSYWLGLVGSIYYELCENGYGSTFYKFKNPDRELIYCDEEEQSFYKSKYYTLKRDEN